MLIADGQLAGTPSVLFDTVVAIILSNEGIKTLYGESAAIDFVRDDFGHLKAIALDKGGQTLLRIANVGQDAGVVDDNDKDAFFDAAKTRQWHYSPHLKKEFIIDIPGRFSYTPVKKKLLIKRVFLILIFPFRS